MEYLYELSVRLVNLAENAGRVFHKVFDGIHVVEGHKKDVLGPRTEKHLVLESHGHQVVELCGGTHVHDFTDMAMKIKRNAAAVSLAAEGATYGNVQSNMDGSVLQNYSCTQCKT